MYLVTIEHDDGTWWDDPNGFDTLSEAKEYAASRGKVASAGICIAIYSCSLLTTIEHSPQDKDGVRQDGR